MKYVSSFLLLFITISCFAQADVYNITKHGATGDGKTINTRAIQQTIDECSMKGGGKVIIPVGTFVSGTLHLKSNVNLYLESGAILKGSANLNDYEPYEQIHWGLFYNT